MYHDWKDVLARAGKTFVQGFVGVLVVVAPAAWEGIMRDPVNAAPPLLISAAAAGVAAVLSFVWNTVKPPQ